jgi:hypothetical protein
MYSLLYFISHPTDVSNATISGLVDWIKKRTTLETVHLPLWELCKGNLEGGLLYWEPWNLCKNVKEGFGNAASLSLPRVCEGNLEGRLLYRGLRETSNGRLWKWSISFIVLHTGNLRHFAREGLANMLLGQNLYLIYSYVMYNLGVCGLIFDHNILSDTSLWAQQAEPRGS